ncbi:transketolase [Candidatus Tisiphia endosymbiont of Ditula angustiorana]|uniref:transketolase family protein n=1 Tax=Candidatus Tisiphia endosymbiont of Ditula angustiorana TaxID=3066272 RepID=UPI00312C98D5
MKFNKIPKYSEKYCKLSDCIRVLASDSIEHAKSGHPGMVLGMADVMTVLVFDFLKFNPNDPTWFDRDRLVLSAGHGSMLLYSFYYLTNYKNFYLEDLKQFRKLHSKTPGHPEYGAYEAIEATTGPLGQGFATSVGMAIGQKKYQQKLGKDLSDHKIYCIIGDGCLMEGISYEAASLAGHLCLNNLIVLFDDNKISIDGPTNLTVSEDHLLKFAAMGWITESIDGHDFEQINASLTRAKNSDKPYFIACRTLIAKGSINKVNSNAAHGSPLGKDEVKLLKENLGFKDEEFGLPKKLKDLWGIAWLRNQVSYNNWQENFVDISQEQKAYFARPNIDCSFLDNIPIPVKDEATRSSSGRIVEELSKLSDKIIFGSADLSLSNNIKNNHSKVISKDDFSGNYIHYGVRENAMGSIMNGLSLSGFLPVGATFLVFSDYMKPSMRLSAIMQQQVIYIMTHDSIGVGEDGPTHQPIEHLASLRSLPNMMVLRPADYIETAESWRIALSNKQGPSVLALTRQAVPQITKIQDRENQIVSHISSQNLCSKGGYILSGFISFPRLHSLSSLRRQGYKENHERLLDIMDSRLRGNDIGNRDNNECSDEDDISNRDDGQTITIFATGSELSIALKVQELLTNHGFKSEVISILCFELFFKQKPSYIQNILSRGNLKVAIEAASSFGWHRIIGENGLFFGVDQFGLSSCSEDVYSYFGLTPSNILEKIMVKIKEMKERIRDKN